MLMTFVKATVSAAIVIAVTELCPISCVKSVPAENMKSHSGPLR